MLPTKFLNTLEHFWNESEQFLFWLISAKHYNITTLTGSGETAGTSAKIYVKLFGALGESEEIQLSGKEQVVFKPGE